MNPKAVVIRRRHQNSFFQSAYCTKPAAQPAKRRRHTMCQPLAGGAGRSVVSLPHQASQCAPGIPAALLLGG